MICPWRPAATLVVPAFLGSIAVNHSAIARHSRASMERGSLFAAHLGKTFQASETIKALRRPNLRSDRTEAHLVRFIQSMFSLAKLDVWMTAMSTLISGMAGVAILWLGGTPRPHWRTNDWSAPVLLHARHHHARTSWPIGKRELEDP
jgi:ABC-type bacteriocin/lantibiotic exporter with double-glycine peptidase domain